MKRFALILLFGLAQAQAIGAELPKDVAAFIDRRENCDHFRGEPFESGDRKRLAEINRGVRKFCTGTDQQLARLKKKYAVDPGITAQLAEFESDIEPKPTPRSR